MNAHDDLDHARRELGLSVETLWLAYVALGGSGSLSSTNGYFATSLPRLSAREYDYMAQALNDRYVDLGRDHVVPYADTRSALDF